MLLPWLLLMLLDSSCAAPAAREVYRMPQSALKGKTPPPLRSATHRMLRSMQEVRMRN